MDKNAIWEAIKEPLRLLVLAVIPFLLLYFGTINAEWAVTLTVVLRFIDKLLHELGKQEEATNNTKFPTTSVLTGGLTRF